MTIFVGGLVNNILIIQPIAAQNSSDFSCDFDFDFNCEPENSNAGWCTDGIDNDRDGKIDSNDNDCPSAPPVVEETCNGIDDNNDGQIDEGCAVPAKEICDNGIDDNNDGQIDEGCAVPQDGALANQLAIDIQIKKPTIKLGEKQTITVTAIDKISNKIVGASIHGKVTYQNGYTKSFSDNDGKADYSWKIGSNTDPGIFTVTADASAKGYDPKQGSNIFNVVNEDGSLPGNGSLPADGNFDWIIPVVLLGAIGAGIGGYAKHKSSKKVPQSHVKVKTQGGIEDH